MTFRRYRPRFRRGPDVRVAGSGRIGGAGGAGQAPAGQAPMNMANMDHRGGIRGTVRGANNAPVADTAVTAVDADDGRQVRGDDGRAGRVCVRRAAGRQLQHHSRVGRSDRLPAQGVAVTADQNVQLDITLDAASAAQAADAERQELLQQVAD